MGGTTITIFHICCRIYGATSSIYGEILFSPSFAGLFILNFIPQLANIRSEGFILFIFRLKLKKIKKKKS